MTTYRSKGGFAAATPDGTRVVAGGELVPEDDPILKTHKALFEPVEDFTARRAAIPTSAGAVETATAAPGETRTTDVGRRRGAGQKGGQ